MNETNNNKQQQNSHKYEQISTNDNKYNRYQQISTNINKYDEISIDINN